MLGFFEDGMNLSKDSEEVYIFPKGRLSKHVPDQRCQLHMASALHYMYMFPAFILTKFAYKADNSGHSPDIPNPYIWLKMALILELSISETSSFTHTFHFLH